MQHNAAHTHSWQAAAEKRFQEEHIMFDMTKIGHTISRLRKEAQLTQMELADRLGISFQAVSNWERGVSMPDIAKLTELSDILGTSIDVILGNRRAAELVQEIVREKPDIQIEKEELVEIAPVLKPSQNDELLKRRGALDIDELVSVAPHLSDDFLDEAATYLYRKTGTLEPFKRLAPFLSETAIRSVSMEIMNGGGSLEDLKALYPYMEDDNLTALAKKEFDKHKDLKTIKDMAPFLPEEFIDECARITLEKSDNDLASITSVAPFMSEAALNKLAKAAIETKGLKALSPIMPFIDEAIIEEYLRQRMV